MSCEKKYQSIIDGRRITIEGVLARLPEYIHVDLSTYGSTREKVRFIDDKYGEFWAYPHDVFQGHGHKKRASERISKSKIVPIEIVKSKLPSYISIKDETYHGVKSNAYFTDNEYGEFVATPNDVFIGKGHRQRSISEKRNIKLTIEEVKGLLPSYVRLVESTYKNMMTKCSFVDEEFGEFATTPNSIIRGGTKHKKRAARNRKETCLKIYGVDHPSKDKEIYRKMCSKMRRTTEKIHWKTGEVLLCTGSYEVAVVDYLNYFKIDFLWQLPFELKVGTYYCDLWIPAGNLYVEVKGWWKQEISKKKWEEFHRTRPDAELWDLPRLKEIGILPLERKFKLWGTNPK